MPDTAELGRDDVAAGRRETLSAERTAMRHHAAAAEHHRWAARIHRTVSRFCKGRHDYAQAAGQASIARDHTVQALEHAKAAGLYYALHDGSALPDGLESLVLMAGKVSGRVAWDCGGLAHHAVAADHEELAARYQDFATRHCDEHDHALAMRALRIAYVHGLQSLFYATRLPNSLLGSPVSSMPARGLHESVTTEGETPTV
jgi:hypothetical protein